MNEIDLLSESPRRKKSFINAVIVAAFFVLVSLVVFYLWRGPQKGRIVWEIREASGKQLDKGVLIPYVRGMQIKPLTSDSSLQTIRINQEFALDIVALPTIAKDNVRVIMIMAVRQSSEVANETAMGGFGFKVLDGQIAQSPKTGDKILYRAERVQSRWKILRIDFPSDTDFIIKPLNSRDHARLWTLRIFKDSYIDWP